MKWIICDEKTNEILGRYPTKEAADKDNMLFFNKKGIIGVKYETKS
jgi:hypothetical protein